MKSDVLLRDLIKRCERNFPSSVAYIDGDRKATWKEVGERASRFAETLQRLGIQKGDVVAIISKEHLEVCEHIFACFMIGAVRVGVNILYSGQEIKHVIEDSNAKLILVDVDCLHLIRGFAEQLASQGRVLMGYGGEHQLPYDYEKCLVESIGKPVLPQLSEEDVAMLTYTSGTTGMPKGVMISQKAIRESIQNTVLSIGLRHEDVWFNSTASGWVTIIMTIFNLANGMTAVLPNGTFDVRRFLEFVEKHKVTSVIFAPLMMQRLLNVVEEREYDLSSLRIITYGSSPASPSLLKKMMEKFPRSELLQMYGISESAGGWVTYLYHRDHLRGMEDKPELLSSCGRPGLHMELIIMNERGQPLPPGEIGELWIRSETNMTGYYNMGELTSQTLIDGWLRTHDIGWMDEEGYLYLTDRKNFLIITGGVNVYPSVVENAITEHEAVREVAVVGSLHPEWGEAVVAMVSLHPKMQATQEELIQYCKNKLGKFEVPKYIEIVDELPKGVTGKILKKQIKDLYLKHPEKLPWNLEKLSRDF